MDLANNGRREDTPCIGQGPKVPPTIEEVPGGDWHGDLAGSKDEGRYRYGGLSGLVDANEGPAKGAELLGRNLEVFGDDME